MLDVDCFDLFTDLCQRLRNPPRYQDGGDHRQQQRSQRDQQDDQDLYPDRLHQVVPTDRHHHSEFPSAAGDWTDLCPFPVRMEPVRSVFRFPCHQRTFLRFAHRINLFPFPVEEEQLFPESGTIADHGGQDPADALLDFNKAARIAEIVVISDHKGDEFPAVGVRYIFGERFILSRIIKQVLCLLPVQ